jgi:glycosyltransferase involved in cell wall biosynthesis
VTTKRILFISTMEAAQWGGSEELWSAGALALLQRDYGVGACLRKWPSAHATVRALQAHGMSVHYRDPGSLVQRFSRRLGGFGRSLLKRSRPTMVVISEGGSFTGIEWMEACQSLGVPYAAVIHFVAPWAWPSDQAAPRLRAAYEGAAKVYFVSEANLALTERHLDCRLANAAVVRNPYKVPYHTDITWPAKEIPRWGCVSRLDTYIKGLDLLIDVLAAEKWRNRSLRVTLYGNGRNEQSLKGLCDRKALSNVEFGGYVSNPVDIWGREHCLILPSRAEGLPLAIVEAMLCSRPCIVTDVAGNAELLEDGVSGFLAETATVSALDDAMERAWQKRDLWETMGKAAAACARRAVPENAGEAFADDLLSVMTRTLATKPCGSKVVASVG